MRRDRDQGEPISAGRQDRRAAVGRAFGDVLFAVALFTAVVLVNGILAIMLIELFQAAGWWDTSVLPGGDDSTTLAAASNSYIGRADAVRERCSSKVR